MATKYTPSYVDLTKPTAPAAYVASAPYKEYVSDAVAPEAYQLGTYTSRYGDQLDAAVNTITNWNYDPMKDASYQALAKIYGARGNIAAKNSLADAAALNGGYGTSYATSAAQQARNQYNQELASLIPDLEERAYNRASGTLSALREAENTDYGRYRDTEGDRQWQYGQNYQAYRDKEADNQWRYQQGYNAYRDTEADRQWLYSQNYNKYRDLMSDYQWGINYNNDLYQWNEAQKKSSGGGGGGGGRRSSGGGGYSSGGGSVSPISTSYLAANALSTAAKGVAATAKAVGKVASGNIDTTKKKTGNGGR